MAPDLPHAEDGSHVEWVDSIIILYKKSANLIPTASLQCIFSLRRVVLSSKSPRTSRTEVLDRKQLVAVGR